MYQEYKSIILPNIISLNVIKHYYTIEVIINQGEKEKSFCLLKYDIVLIRLPVPKALLEAYFVALIYRSQKNKKRAITRYILFWAVSKASSTNPDSA